MDKEKSSSFEPRDVIINTWLPVDMIKEAVSKTEEKAIEMIKQMLEKEGLDGSENTGGDRVETDSCSE